MAQSALTGYRKYRSPDVANINARKPFLSSIYNQKRSDQYADKQYDLQQQGLEQSQRFGEQNLDLAQDVAKQGRKRDRLAEKLGYAGLGLQAGFGVLNNSDTLAGMFQPEDVAADFGGQAIQGLGESAVQDSWSGMFGDMFSDPLRNLGAGLLGGGGSGVSDGILDSVIDWGSIGMEGMW
jgi:hypothetical protein